MYKFLRNAICAMFFFFSFYVAFILIVKAYYTISTGSWIETSAVVTKSYVDQTTVVSGGRGIYFSNAATAVFVYSYKVNDAIYKGDNNGMKYTRLAGSYEQAREDLKGFYEGDKITVLYNPKNKAESIVPIMFSTDDIIIAIMSISFFLFGLVGLTKVK